MLRQIRIWLIIFWLVFPLTMNEMRAEPLLESLLEEADALFAKDYIESSLRRSIILYEEAVKIAPNNTYILNRLSEAYYKLGYVHLFVLAENPEAEAVKKERLSSYTKGKEYGMRSLELNPRFVEVKKKQSFKEALQEITDIAALHWLSCNWGAILETAGIFRALSELPKLRAVLERALASELDETYMYGGPLRAMATYLAGTPSIFGGNLEKARELFEESINRFPDFLGNRALYTQHYLSHAKVKNCPAVQDQVSLIRDTQPHKEYLIWDIAAKEGIEKFLKTIDWCSIPPAQEK